MPLVRPARGMDISAEDFGQPVYDLVTPTPWYTLPLGAPWVHWVGETVQYRKVGDVVQLRGRGTGGVGNTAFLLFGALPTGFRPPNTIMMLVPCVYASAWAPMILSVGLDGNIVPMSNSNDIAPTMSFATTA